MNNSTGPRPSAVFSNAAITLLDVLFPPQAPLVQHVVVRTRPVPAKVDKPDGFLIGQSVHWGQVIVAREEDLKRHILIIGASGSGKTTLLSRLFDQEILRWQ